MSRGGCGALLAHLEGIGELGEGVDDVCCFAVEFLETLEGCYVGFGDFVEEGFD